MFVNHPPSVTGESLTVIRADSEKAKEIGRKFDEFFFLSGMP
jgi:hypothetical protein